jgi:hypothetical protein
VDAAPSKDLARTERPNVELAQPRESRRSQAWRSWRTASPIRPSRPPTAMSLTTVPGPIFSPTEIKVEQEGKRFLLRSALRPAASLALPPTVRQLADA